MKEDEEDRSARLDVRRTREIGGGLTNEKEKERKTRKRLKRKKRERDKILLSYGKKKRSEVSLPQEKRGRERVKETNVDFRSLQKKKTMSKRLRKQTLDAL